MIGNEDDAQKREEKEEWRVNHQENGSGKRIRKWRKREEGRTTASKENWKVNLKNEEKWTVKNSKDKKEKKKKTTSVKDLKNTHGKAKQKGK